MRAGHAMRDSTKTAETLKPVRVLSFFRVLRVSVVF